METSEGIQKGSTAVGTDFRISHKNHSHNERQFTASLLLNISDAKENPFDSFITYTFLKDKSKKGNGILEKQWSANTALELFRWKLGKKKKKKKCIAEVAVIANCYISLLKLMRHKFPYW